ncbi:MAG: hypothetical protein M1823_006224 [Watsoniomyces obsoletus]|nr:MAG: hypothetical protein M1823_006224 [Watsoniomyces obsoletus]
MSWTACYDDSCLTHLSEKQGSNYFPRERRRRRSKGKQRQDTLPEVPETPTSATVMMEKYEEMTAKIDRLEAELRKLRGNLLEEEYDVLDWADDLVEEFKPTKLETPERDESGRSTTAKPSPGSGLPIPVPDKPTLKRQDATLSEIGDYRTSRWTDEELAEATFKHHGSQVDLAMSISGECSKNWWKACTDMFCRKHLTNKRKNRWFPGADPLQMFRALHKQHSYTDQCDQEDWELCFVTKFSRHWAERQAMGLDDSKN